jgi:5-(carboxyamino)imidazole ribonucleotide mutase/phosphoribosylaminoimidazole-succinocarboxamide synthase
MMDVLVPILMGSSADLEHAQIIADTLEKLEIPYEMQIGSAHKTPAHVLDILQRYEADPRPKVYITIAGRSNALSGFVDAQVSSPVVACPPLSGTFGGADIYSSLRMPSGVVPAVIIEPAGAALLAAKMFGLLDPDIKARVQAWQQALVSKVLEANKAIPRNAA